MNELTQLVTLMKEMNERLKRIEENTRPEQALIFDDADIEKAAKMFAPKENATVFLTREQEEQIRRTMEAAKSYDSFRVDPYEERPSLMHYARDFDGAHHVAERNER